MSILDEIFAHKRTEVAALKQAVPLARLEQTAAGLPAPPDFIAALRSPAKAAPRLIAEVKKRSPSKGLLCPDFDPLALARTYAGNGAAAISVLTDEKYFGGSLSYLKSISQLERGRPPLPLLRKEFIFDRFQLLEARLAGASAALLIVAMLSDSDLSGLIQAARDLQLAPLVEVHTRAELDRALHAGADLVGVNNRDLHTFTVSLDTTLELRRHVPDSITLVAESGIKTLDDVKRLAAAGIHAMLIGEGIVTAPDRARQVRLLSQTGA